MPSPNRSDPHSPIVEEKAGHPSPVAEEKTDILSSERQKLEEEDDSDDDKDSSSSEDDSDEEVQRFYDEWNKSQGFEIDFSKVTYCGSWKAVDLDKTAFHSDGTGREFLTRLANMALMDHNAKQNKNLQLSKILRANHHPSAGLTYYISFEVTDPSRGNQTKPYRAVVRYLNERDHEVYSCFAKPSSY